MEIQLFSKGKWNIGHGGALAPPEKGVALVIAKITSRIDTRLKCYEIENRNHAQ